jgi:16S rRNA (adenine1518-N6/adenine1519-N6)-dimethyltransferase
VKPRKRFGQHFLEPAWVRKVVAVIAPAGGDRFLEIGPGRGALTLALAASGANVVAVEVDRDLASALAVTAPANVRIITGDFLTLPTEAWREGRNSYRVAANLPYSVATPILFHLLALAREQVVVDAVLMLQREVAERLAAVPGTRDYGPLAIMTAVQATVERLMTLPPGAFRPPPQVQSAVVRLRFHAPIVVGDELAALDRLVRGLFTQRRKTLSNALRKALDSETGPPEVSGLLEAVGIDGRQRPEMLSIGDLIRLAGVAMHRR